MLKIDKLSYSYPEKDLYNDISFTLEKGQQAAFIGTNGSGKSTLLDIIINPDNYMFDGTLEMDPNCRIGYVKQFSQLDKGQEVSVFDYIAEIFINLQNEITAICTEMETAEDIEPVLERYQEALDAFNAIEGDDFENVITKKLNSIDLLKLKDSMISEISSGEFKLIQVVKAMLTNPDLLIMDEPDVFLDFDNLNALKNLINVHKGTMIVITHNRYLLNHCFNKILHLENMEIQEFDGNYVDYNFYLLQTKIELQELAAADDAEIERNELLIKKLRDLATENAEAFRGRKLNARVKIQERLEKRRIKAPFIAIKEPDINLIADNELKEDVTVLKATDFSVSFDELLLENVTFEMNSTDKVAIIGANGTGKTTLLQEIFENNNSSIEVNEEVEMAYLSQIQGKTLNENNSLVDEFFDFGFKSYEQISVHLSRYGFEEEKLKQKIGNLSGGEKNMLQLAKISASTANLLLLDEPTSHLDVYSQIALEKAMKNYKGAILMVSHDFYSIVNCMDYVLLVEDKTIRKMSMRKFRKMIYASH
ncbi:MAG: ABC-F family ATP-binding cassette domain-containing protein, partial [Sarcina sp.]